MSKYGPTWLRPATGQSSIQVLPFPAYNRGERDQTIDTAATPQPQAIRVLCRVSECIPLSPHQAGPAREAWLGSQEGEVVATASRKGKIRCQGSWGSPRPGVGPKMLQGSDVTLIPQNGLAYLGEWGGQKRPVTNHQNTQVLCSPQG